MFTREQLANIVKGNPTPDAIAAGQQAVELANKGLPGASSAQAPGKGPRRPTLLESNDPLAVAASLEAEMQRRVARKAAQAPTQPAPVVLQEAAPVKRPAEKFTPPPGGYPGPGLPAHGQRGSAGQYEAGEVPASALNRFFPGMAPAAAPPAGPASRRSLYEHHVPGPTPPTAPINTEDVRQVVREVLFAEILEQKTLLPLLENLVKTTLHLVVREELERLKNMGQKK
jgi:hypothetical protein